MNTSRSNSVCTNEIGTTEDPLDDYPEKFLSHLKAEYYSKKSIRLRRQKSVGALYLFDTELVTVSAFSC